MMHIYMKKKESEEGMNHQGTQRRRNGRMAGEGEPIYLLLGCLVRSEEEEDGEEQAATASKKKKRLITSKVLLLSCWLVASS
jgi:hypothetical protein